ncbi:MAG: adenosylhomocysteinase, partial [Oscillospiraceae bacterium]|nr:adenosylhomocysteinase [Oscillospiraceae bacterium]
FVLADGRLVNLASGDGHPVEIMDMSFAIQALSTAHLTKHRDLSPAVHAVPQEIDTEVAKRWLNASGKNIDVLTDAQKKYLNSWGTL